MTCTLSTPIHKGRLVETATIRSPEVIVRNPEMISKYSQLHIPRHKHTGSMPDPMPSLTTFHDYLFRPPLITP